MTAEKKKYWEEQGWSPLSPGRKYAWSVSNPSDFQDILTTHECMIPDPDDVDGQPVGATDGDKEV